MKYTEPRYCSNCGKGFDARIRDLRAKNGRYCSRVCSGIERAKTRNRGSLAVLINETNKEKGK